MEWFFLMVLGIAVCFGIFGGVFCYGLSKLPPDDRQQVCQEMGRQINKGVEQWREEQRQAKAAKRARSTAVWNVVGQIAKRL